ncbi:MAG: cysteine hydrolase family protein [Candidatus Methanofastidiosia archaeon]|jgi:nicotinamidase-related amidase
MSRSALLIIDVQVGNFEGSEPVYNGKELLTRIHKLITIARTESVPIFYVQHCGPEGAIDEPGTHGWDIHPIITPGAGDSVIQKYHPDAFQDTNLQSELELKSITRLVITGIQTEYCIDTTCRRAYSLGYDVTLVKDAHSTWDTDILTAEQIIAYHNTVLGNWFAKVKETDEIIFVSR